MKNKIEECDVLMFIPDINGYTEYLCMHDTENAHLIIEKLLNAIGKADRLDFKVSDILGDAIFMYKQTQNVCIDEIKKQCMEMNRALEVELLNISNSYGKLAPTNTKNLSLKFIVHYGKVRISEILNRRNKQLIGKCVIETHSLLKNRTGQDSYLLITEACLNAANADLTKFDMVTENFDELGELKFSIVPLIK